MTTAYNPKSEKLCDWFWKEENLERYIRLTEDEEPFYGCFTFWDFVHYYRINGFPIQDVMLDKFDIIDIVNKYATKRIDKKGGWDRGKILESNNYDYRNTNYLQLYTYLLASHENRKFITECIKSGGKNNHCFSQISLNNFQL